MLDAGNSLYSVLTAAGSAVWGMLEGAGGTSADSSGNGHGLTLDGSVTWSTNGGGEAILACAGSSGTACAVTSPVTFGSSSAWSLAFRAKTTASSYQTITGNNGSGQNWLAANDGNFIYYSPTSGNAQLFLSETDFHTDADWMLVIDGPNSRIHLYRNGVECVDSPKTMSGADSGFSLHAIASGYDASGSFSLVGTFTYAYLMAGYAANSTDASNLHADPYSIFAPSAPSSPDFLWQRRLRAETISLEGQAEPGRPRWRQHMAPVGYGGDFLEWLKRPRLITVTSTFAVKRPTGSTSTGTGLQQIEFMPWKRTTVPFPDPPPFERPEPAKPWITPISPPAKDMPWFFRPLVEPLAEIVVGPRPRWGPHLLGFGAGGDYMEWRHRPPGPEPWPETRVEGRHWTVALLTGTGLPQLETLTWKRTTGAFPDPPPFEPSRTKWGPETLAGTAIPQVVFNPIIRWPEVQEYHYDFQQARPGWNPSLGTGTPLPPYDMLPWRKVTGAFPDPPPFEPSRMHWTPGLTTGAAVPQVETAVWKHVTGAFLPPPPFEPARPGWRPAMLTGTPLAQVTYVPTAEFRELEPLPPEFVRPVPVWFPGIPTPPHQLSGTGQPYLSRLPREYDERRLARFTEKLSILVNSLFGSGQVVQTGPTTFQIRTVDGDAFVIQTQLWTDQTEPSAAVGHVVARLPVYNAQGSLIGYLPLYDS